MASPSRAFPTSVSAGAAGRQPRLTAARITATLVLHDAAHEWRLTLCMVLGLAAVLTPLLILFGVKFGVVNTLTARLLEDPRNREIVPIGSGRFGPDWFADVERRPEVAFVIPKTRAIAATMRLRNPSTRRDPPVTGDLVPSAAGDPLIEGRAGPPEGFSRVILSEPVARKIGIGRGDTVEGSLLRTRDGQRERVVLELAVIEVLPYAAFAGDAALVSLELLEATEAYRDGFGVPAVGWSGEPRPEGERNFTGFRMYARSIYDVPQLRTVLVEQGIEVRTRSAEIENLQALDRNLTRVFWIIALIGSTGYVLSLGASLWAAVDRKGRELSVLLLLGFPGRSVILFPVLNAALVGLLGALLALLLYFPIQAGINQLFGENLEAGEAVALLLPHHAAAAVVATLMVALVGSALAGTRAARIEPAEGIRDV